MSSRNKNKLVVDDDDDTVMLDNNDENKKTEQNTTEDSLLSDEVLESVDMSTMTKRATRTSISYKEESDEENHEGDEGEDGNDEETKNEDKEYKGETEIRRRRIIRRSTRKRIEAKKINLKDYDLPRRSLRQRDGRINYEEPSDEISEMDSTTTRRKTNRKNLKNAKNEEEEEEDDDDVEDDVEDDSEEDTEEIGKGKNGETSTEEKDDSDVASEAEKQSSEEEKTIRPRQVRRLRTRGRGRGRGRSKSTNKRRRRVVSDDEDESDDESDDMEEYEEMGYVEPEDAKPDDVEEEEDDEEDLVEKIIACRLVQTTSDDEDDNESNNGSNDKEKKEKTQKENKEDPDDDGKIEYLVKYKDKSYIHCEWVSSDVIESQHLGRSKLQRFHQKYSLESFEGLTDGEYFNPDYTEVDRILDVTFYSRKKCFLVKWKSLPYHEASWEFEDKIEDKIKIEEFYRNRKYPLRYKVPPRPPARFFKKLEQSPKFRDGNELRSYQLEGLNWLVYCWYQRRNSILADEMGLGKTVQTVSILEYLRVHQHNRGPFLIVAPLSTIAHWRREIETWTEMNCIVFHGQAESREKLIDYEWFFRDSRGKVVPGLYKFHVLITTYEMILSEPKTLGKVPWQYMVVDEGHRLKNKNSKLLEILRTFKSSHKLLLTGTPLQNDIGELWTLLNFLDYEKFPNRDSFLKKFGLMQDSSEVELLHKEIGPYLLRRLKEDVEKSIPPKEEIIVEVVPTNVQKTYYRAILDRNRDFLKRGISKSKNVPQLVNILMEIRKVCNHPYLIQGAEHTITKSLPQDSHGEMLVKCSSKLVLVDKLLKKLREGKHKVLIFSQMVMVLNILEDYCNFRQYPYCRLDGTIRGDERQASIDRFCDPNVDTFVFLVSTRAGGVGINLTAADTVIIYDSDFNPQNDIQAQARCHRIGQSKEVKVYRLLTKNTKEKELFERASRKLGLDRAVLNSNSEYYKQGGSNNKVGLEKEQIDYLLKHGAYAAIKVDDSEDQKLLMTGDIDSILERNATVVRYDEPQSEKGLSSFSKASFVSSEDDMEVDINDKDFWKKILPDNKTAEGLMRQLGSNDSLKTEEDKEEFMKDLKALVDSKLEEIEKFRYKDDEVLGTLLTQAMYSSKLNHEKREIARNWSDILDKPRLRSGKNEDLGDSEENGSGSEYDGSDNEANKARVAKSGTVKKGGWFKAERNRFQKALLDFGWGKWDMTQHKLKNHSLHELQSFAESIIIQLMKYVDDQGNIDFLKQMIRSNAFPEEEPKAPADEEKEETEEGGGDKVENHPKKEEDLDAKSAEETSTGQNTKSNHLKISASNTITACTPIDIHLPDTQYLEDPCRIEFIEIGTPNLCVRLYDLSPHEKITQCISIPSPGYHAKFFIRFVSKNYVATSDTFEVSGAHPLLTEEEWTDQCKRGAKNWVKKLRFTNDLNKVIEHYGKRLKKIKLPQSGLKKLAEWWDDDCDKDLLIGSTIHGYGKIENVKEDDDLCIKSKYDKFKKNAKAKDKSFPTASVLNKRVAKMVAALLAQKDLSTTGDSSSKGRLKKGATTEEWSKREKQDVQKCLNQYGLCPNEDGEPQWDQIIEKAKLRKTAESVENYANEFMEMVKRIASNDSEPEDSSNKNDKKKKASQSSNKKTVVEDLTLQSAKKIEQRVKLMNKLTQFVFPCISEYEDKICLLKMAGTGLPKWYKEKKHDIALLKGVKQYGFDFKKIFSEDSLFSSSKISSASNKKPIVSPPIREGICISRLESLAALYEKYKVVGSPSKAKSSWDFTGKKSHLTLKSPPKELNKESEKKLRIRKSNKSKSKKESSSHQTKISDFTKKTNTDTRNQTGEDIENVSDDNQFEKYFPEPLSSPKKKSSIIETSRIPKKKKEQNHSVSMSESPKNRRVVKRNRNEFQHEDHNNGNSSTVALSADTTNDVSNKEKKKRKINTIEKPIEDDNLNTLVQENHSNWTAGQSPSYGEDVALLGEKEEEEEDFSNTTINLD